MNVVPVEISPIRAFQRCPNNFRYRYVEDLEPIMLPQVVRIGVEVHRIMQDRWTIGFDKALERLELEWATLMEVERETYGDIPGAIRRLVRSYQHEYDGDTWEPKLVEHTVEGELRGVPYRGRVDLVANIPALGPGLTVVDYKTTSRFPEDTIQLLDPQTAFYAWMLRREGFDVQRVMFDYILSSPPTKPAVVGLSEKPHKDGTFAPGKGPRLSGRDIRTDVWTVLEAIDEYAPEHPEITRERYADYLRELQAAPNPFFKRVELRLTTELLDKVVRELFGMRWLIEGAMKANIFPRHVSGLTCPSCMYKRLCVAEMAGLPEEVTEELSQFVKRPWRETPTGGEDGA